MQGHVVFFFVNFKTFIINIFVHYIVVPYLCLTTCKFIPGINYYVNYIIIYLTTLHQIQKRLCYLQYFIQYTRCLFPTNSDKKKKRVGLEGHVVMNQPMRIVFRARETADV